MKTSMKLFLLIAFVSACSTAAFSQTRIHFNRGATTTVVTGTLNGYNSHRTYIIRVRNGQTLTTKSVGTNYITVGLERTGNQANRANQSGDRRRWRRGAATNRGLRSAGRRSEEHTSELQSRQYLVCR